MSETDITLLEPTCADVDVKWMALRGWVQVGKGGFGCQALGGELGSMLARQTAYCML